MKKTKLISSLTALGLVGTSVPIVATSCTNESKENYIVVSGNKISMPEVVTQADINGLGVVSYTFAKNVTHDAVFVNGEYIEADLISEICIKNTDGTDMNLPAYFISYSSSGFHGCVNLRKLDLKAVRVKCNNNNSQRIAIEGCANSLMELSVPTMVDDGSGMALGILGLYYQFDALEKIDLSGFSDVELTIDYFLYGCTSLRSIDLTPMKKLTQWGNNFMANCYKLESVNMSGLSKLNMIQTSAFENCYALKEINLNGCTNVQEISANFLMNCSSLKTIDLSSFVNLTKIYQNFLSDCSSLTSVDLSHSELLIADGCFNNGSFLQNCPNLEQVKFGIIPATAFGSSLTTADTTSFTNTFATQADYDNWMTKHNGVIKIIVNSSVQTGWNTVAASGGRFAPLATTWTSSDDAFRTLEVSTEE